ncbi:MAG: hypothetical protein EHM14_15950 [Methanothrix sp.]|nr:MAG: hypothetical protein EHM14_15950 [Methanothrix sp.]
MSGKTAKAERRALELVPKPQTTRRQVLAVWNVLEELSDRKSDDLRWAYHVAKNKALIKPEVDALRAAQKPDEDFDAYDKARIELCKNHAQRDPNTHEPLTTDNGRRFLIDHTRQAEFDAAAEKLKEEHKPALDRYEEKMKAFEKFLDEEIPSPVWHPIPYMCLPKDITPRQVEVLIDVVKEA